jgi:hypothetical protein
MGQTNEPQPVIPMMPQQAPALAANHQPYAPLSQEKIEMPQMNEPQNLHPQNPAGSE